MSGFRDEEASVGVPVEVRFNALGREFHFELEAASQLFTDMSHVLIRRWVRFIMDCAVMFIQGRYVW